LAIQYRKTSLAEDKGLECFIASFAEIQEFSVTGPDTASRWPASAGEENRVNFVCGKPKTTTTWTNTGLLEGLSEKAS
jgi:hypothetical protein